MKKILIVLALCLMATPCYAWVSGYSYRKPVVIDNTKVDGTLTNFPVYVNVTTLGGKCETSGFDVIFAKSDDTLLDFHRAYWDGTDAGKFFVEVDSIASGADTTIYMYYGNSGASDTSSAANTWNSDYVEVHYLWDDAANTTVVAAKGNTGTLEGGDNTNTLSTSGKIYKALNFNGTDDRVDIGDNGSCNGATELTISCWANLDTLTAGDAFARNYEAAGKQFAFDVQDISGNDADVKLTINANGQVKDWTTDSRTTFLGAGWIHVMGCWEGGLNGAIYINGTESASTAGGAGTPVALVNTNSEIAYGAREDGAAATLDGALELMTISTVDRGAAWAKAEYNSGNDSLLSLGSEESPPSSGTTAFGGITISGVTLQ